MIVNNASTAPDQWAIAGTTDLSPVAEALDVNLFGAWRVIQALLPLLRSSPRPRVVNVSSEGGSIALMSGGRPAYSVSKAALNALTRMLAGELYRDGILVNAVCPGWTSGDSATGGRRGSGGRRPGRRQRGVGGHPAQRRPHRHLHQGRPRAALVKGSPVARVTG